MRTFSFYIVNITSNNLAVRLIPIASPQSEHVAFREQLKKATVEFHKANIKYYYKCFVLLLFLPPIISYVTPVSKVINMRRVMRAMKDLAQADFQHFCL